MEYARLVIGLGLGVIGLIWLYRQPANVVSPPMPKGPIVFILLSMLILSSSQEESKASAVKTSAVNVLHECGSVLDLKNPSIYVPIAFVADEDRTYYLVDTLLAEGDEGEDEEDSVIGCYFDKDDRYQKLPFEFPQAVVLDGGAMDDYTSPVTQ